MSNDENTLIGGSSPLARTPFCLKKVKPQRTQRAQRIEPLMNADLFGCGFHNVLFFLGQAVERIHQLVYLPLQRARVRLGIVPLHFGATRIIFAGFALFAVKRFRLVGSLAPPKRSPQRCVSTKKFAFIRAIRVKDFASPCAYFAGCRTRSFFSSNSV